MDIIFFRSYIDIIVFVIINNFRVFRLILLINFMDVIFEKRYLYGKRNVELIVF